MLSLRELRRVARILGAKLSGAKIRRVIPMDEHALILSFEMHGARLHVLLSAKPEFGRICTIENPLATESSSFHEFACAHLTGRHLSGIEASGEDRQLQLNLQTAQESFVMILSIMGVRSNIYLLDAGGKLLHSIRPLHLTRRDLKIGDAWTNPRGAAPTEGIDRWEDVEDHLYLHVIGETYEQLEQKREVELTAQRIRNAISKDLAFRGRKAINLQEDLGRAREAQTYKQKGELLKNILHSIRPGADKAVATDYETGEAVEIPLDPKLSPAANLESYFSHFKKDSRGVKAIQQQLDDLAASCAELEKAGQELEEILRNESPDIKALQALASRPGISRLIDRHSPQRKEKADPFPQPKKRDVPARLLPKRYKTEDGLEIWVGRNSEGNDYLSTRLARGNDLFFHLEGYPGSHVVLRTEGRTDPPAGSLLDACELAVHFSKQKNAGSADVHMAPIKDVKKPKGAKPGLVFVRHGKTIRLRRDPKRLQNILAARIDE